MELPLYESLVMAAIMSAILSIRSYRQKSLDLSGAIVGFAVMTAHIVMSCRIGTILLIFISNYLAFKEAREIEKIKVEADFNKGGKRNWAYVLSNSGIATILVLVAWKWAGAQDICLNSNESKLMTCLIGGILGHYCCCNGDTYSSELGKLSGEQPRLITNLKPVRMGTHGGVTISGILAAAMGGISIGIPFVVFGFITTRCSLSIALKQLLLIPLSAVAGLCGSVIDSLLGATLQYSGFCNVRKKVVGKPGPSVTKIAGRNILDNNAVNLVSILLTTVLTSIACAYIF